MRKVIFVCLVLVVGMLVSAQGLKVQPLDDVYVYHLYDSTFTLGELRSWVKSAPPKKGYMQGLGYVDNALFWVNKCTSEDNWVFIDKPTGFIADGTLKKDDKGNVWVYLISHFNDEEVPGYMVRGKSVTGTADLIGVWWVSWYLVPGTRDVYPCFNYIPGGMDLYPFWEFKYNK